MAITADHAKPRTSVPRSLPLMVAIDQLFCSRLTSQVGTRPLGSITASFSMKVVPSGRAVKRKNYS
jgi:hypothetical protein